MTGWLWNGELQETRWARSRYDLEELGDRVRLGLTLENVINPAIPLLEIERRAYQALSPNHEAWGEREKERA